MRASDSRLGRPAPSASPVSLFVKRQDLFLTSLERVLSIVGSDGYIRQMFADGNSAAYIPDRVCELIKMILTDDRENFLQRLMKRLNALEACMGSDRMRKIEEIGTKLVEISSSQNKREAELRGCIRLSREQLSSLQSELVEKYGSRQDELESIQKLEGQGRTIKEIARDVEQSMHAFEDSMRATFMIAKERAKRLMSDVIEKYESQIPDEDVIDQLKAQCERKIGSMKRKLQKAATVMQTQADQIEDLQQQVRTLKKENAAELQRQEKLKKQLREVHADVEIRSEALNSLNEERARELKSSKEKITELKEQLNGKVKEVKQLKQEVVEMQSVAEEMKRKMAKTEKQVEDGRSVMAQQQKQFETELATKNAEVAKVEAQAKDLEKELRASEADFEKAQAAFKVQLTKKDEEIEKLQEDIAMCQKENREATEQHESQKRKMENQHKAAIAKLQKEVNDLSQVTQEQTAKIHEMENENSELKDELKMTQNSLNKEKAKGAQLTSDKEKLKAENADLEVQVQKLNSELGSSNRALMTTKNELQQAMFAQDSAKLAHQKLEEEKKELAEELKETQNKAREQVATLNRELKMKDATIVELEEDVKNGQESLTAATGEFQRRLVEKESQITQFKQSIEKMRHDIGAKNDELESKEEQMEQLKEKHEQIIEQKESKVRELNAQIANLQGNVREMDGTISKFKQRVNEMENREGEQKEAIDDLKVECEKLREIVRTRQEEIKDQQQTNLDLKGQVKKGRETNAELQKRMDIVVKEKERVTAQAEKLEEENDRTRKEVTKLTQTVESLQKKNETLVEEIQREHDKIDELENQIEDNKAKITEQEKGISKLKSSEAQKTKQVEDLKLSIVSQEQVICDAKSMIEELKEAVNEAKDEIVALKTKNDEARKTNEVAQRELNVCQTKLDSVAKEYTEATRENKRLERELEKKQMELTNVQDTCKLNETQQAKKLKEAQARIDSIASACDVRSLEDLPKLVTDLKASSAQDREVIEQIKEITGSNEPISAAKQLKKDSDDLKTFKKKVMPDLADAPVEQLVSSVQEANQSGKQMKAREAELLRVLGIESPDAVVKTVSQMQDAAERQKDVISRLEKALKIESGGDLVDKVETIVSDKRQMETKLASMLDAESPTDAIKQIGSMKQSMSKAKDANGKLCKILGLQSENEIVDAVSQLVNENRDMAEREEQIMVSLAVEDPDTILKRLDEQQLDAGRHAKVVDTLMNTLNCDNDTDVVSQVNQLLEEHAQMIHQQKDIAESLGASSPSKVAERTKYLQGCSKVTQDLCQMLNTTPEMLSSRVVSLVEGNQGLQSLHGLFSDEQRDVSLNDKITQLIDERDALLRDRQQLVDVLKSDDVYRAVRQLLDNISQASHLFSRLVGVLSKSPITITFPLSKPVQDKLIDLISEFKARTDYAQAQIDSIMNRARVIGYEGTDLIDAVDFIAVQQAEMERQKTMEQMHEDLMEVRASNEKQKNAADRQRDKSKKRIADLKALVAQLQEKSAAREEELLSDLDGERKRLRAAMDDLENERKIHEELMMVISGQAADSEYLKSKLSEREMRHLSKAEETRRFIAQMTAKNAESERIHASQRKMRESALMRATQEV